MKNKVFIVEDHPIMRQRLMDAIEQDSDLTVCGHAEDTMEAFASILMTNPDVVVTDFHLKSSNGLNLVMTLSARLPPIPVVVTTMFDLPGTEKAAREAGASGFVPKHSGPDELVTTLKGVLKKEKVKTLNLMTPTQADVYRGQLKRREHQGATNQGE